MKIDQFPPEELKLLNQVNLYKNQKKKIVL